MSSAAAKLHTGDQPRPWHVSRAEYWKMVDAGLLEGKRVQLIEGVIVEMSPMGEPHALAVSALNRILSLRLGKKWSVRVQLPLDVGHDSVPEPDLAAMTTEAERRHFPGAPRTAPFVCEVSDATLKLDRGSKLRLYASAGVAEYVVANVKRAELEVYTSPARVGGYRKKRLIVWGESYSSSALPRVVLRPSEIFHSRR